MLEIDDKWQDDQWLGKLAQDYGTPFIIYDAHAIRTAIAGLQAAMGPESSVVYSVKANPAPAILREMLDAGVGVEVASVGELRLCLRAGFLPHAILFAGPGKDADDLLAAINAGIKAIVVESLDEVLEIQKISAALAVSTNIALRLNLPLAARSAAYGWRSTSPFGISPENLPAIVETLSTLANVRCIGIHHHHGSQGFDPAALVDQLEGVVQAALALSSVFKLEFIDIGGGFGAPYYTDDAALDLRLISQAVHALYAASGPLAGSGIKLIAESGRYLVGPSGYYVAKIASVKTAYGVRFAILDGGTNHMLSMSGVFRAVGRPVNAYVPGRTLRKGLPTELAGPLCTPVDRIGSRVNLPADLKRGDVIVFPGQGAYTKHASPLNFLGHSWPAELLLDGHRVSCFAKRVEFEDVLDLQSTNGGDI